MIRWLIAALCVGVARNAPAQAIDSLGQIDVDRPDFTDGVATVAWRHIQVESGYTYSSASGRGVGYQHSFPELLVRIGVARGVELRLSDNFIVINAGRSVGRRSGFDDFDLGTKVRFLSQHGVLPGISAEASVAVPTGEADVSGNHDRLLPAGAMILGWQGEGPWSAGFEAFASATADDAGSGTASLSVQYQMSQRWQLYVEGFIVRPLDGGGGTERYTDSGVHFFLSNDLQFDARIGAGLGSPSTHWIIGSGFALRH